MLGLYVERASWIAGMTFAIAFGLTFWRGRLQYWLAAAFYSLGTLISIGVNAYAWFVLIGIGYGLSDSGPNTAALIVLPIPIGTAIYAIAAVGLLWPGISQPKALRFGKILHLIVLPLLVGFVFTGAFLRFQGQVFPELRWLVYGPLWFRIREQCFSLSSVQNPEPIK